MRITVLCYIVNPDDSKKIKMIDINSTADTVIVLDFETTGLSPDYGDRAIEIGAVKLVNGDLVDRFQQLMNPHKRISAFIENYTGITNKMLNRAAPCEEVMLAFADFIEDYNLVLYHPDNDGCSIAVVFRNKAQYAGNGHSPCQVL